MTIVLSILASLLNFWNKLPPTIKTILIVIAALFIGFLYGQHKANVKCEAARQEVIERARQIDKAAFDSTLKDANEQKDKYRIQKLESDNKLNEAATEYAKLKEECHVDEDYTRRSDELDAIGSGLSREPSSPKKPATRRSNHPRPGNVQKSETKR